MYSVIGVFDAKAHLSTLLRHIQIGQRYTITVRGKPVADLVPSEALRQPDVNAAIAAMKSMPKIRGVSNAMIAQWIQEARR